MAIVCAQVEERGAAQHPALPAFCDDSKFRAREAISVEGRQRQVELQHPAHPARDLGLVAVSLDVYENLPPFRPEPEQDDISRL